MPFSHEIAAAIPRPGNADPDLLRAVFSGRLPYYLDPDEDPQDFVAVDAETSDVVPTLLWQEKVWFFDADDTTTAHDGITTLVSSDGKRYKYDGTDFRIRSVLDRGLDTPPVSPSLADAYLLPAASTGDWSGHDDDVAVYTARGWAFIPPQVGTMLYVRDEDGFVHYSDGGTWDDGLGNMALPANSVLPASILGGRTRWIVENQTTDTPPASPADGVQYIIGPSPADDWAGHAGKLAIAKDEEWIIVTPTTGVTAYDKAASSEYIYSGSAWQPASSATLRYVYTSSDTWTKPAGLTSSSMVLIEGWGGGGGGSSQATRGGGGGGGGYNFALVPASLLTSSVVVTVGAGGSAGDSQPGTQSTFGSYLTAYPGGGADNSAQTGGGGGGGSDGAGASSTTTAGAAGGDFGGGSGGGLANPGGAGGLPSNPFGGGGGGGPVSSTTSANGGAGGRSHFGGGGGGGATTASSSGAGGAGGNSVFGGGGGGGGGAPTGGAGGTSIVGGNGGAAGVAGTAPGGGGGANAAGARGEIRVTVFR